MLKAKSSREIWKGRSRPGGQPGSIPPRFAFGARLLTRMPFGAHRNQRLVDLPHEYLEWLLTWPHLRDPLRTALWREVERRVRALNRALERSLARAAAADATSTSNQSQPGNGEPSGAAAEAGEASEDHRG